jgi:hypothetical protein
MKCKVAPIVRFRVPRARAGERDRPSGVKRRLEVVVECRDECDQRRIYHWMTGKGKRCRLFTL